MIDYSNEIFNAVAADLRSTYEGIKVVGEYVSSPTHFPTVTIDEIQNIPAHLDSGKQPKYASIVYRIQVFCDALGLGDVKFMIACAMLLGAPGAFFVLLLGSLLGTLYGVVFAVFSRKSLKHATIAFGPFLAAAAVVWLFAGEFLLQIYLQGKLEH